MFCCAFLSSLLIFYPLSVILSDLVNNYQRIANNSALLELALQILIFSFAYFWLAAWFGILGWKLYKGIAWAWFHSFAIILILSCGGFYFAGQSYSNIAGAGIFLVTFVGPFYGESARQYCGITGDDSDDVLRKLFRLIFFYFLLGIGMFILLESMEKAAQNIVVLP